MDQKQVLVTVAEETVVTIDEEQIQDRNNTKGIVSERQHSISSRRKSNISQELKNDTSFSAVTTQNSNNELSTRKISFRSEEMDGQRQSFIKVVKYNDIQMSKAGDDIKQHSQELRRRNTNNPRTFLKSKSRFVETPRYTYNNNTTTTAADAVDKRAPSFSLSSATPRAATDDDDDDPFRSIDFPKVKEHLKVNVWIIAEWILFLGIMALLVCSFTVDGLKRRMLWGLEIWKWCVMVVVFFCGRLVSGWLISLLVFCLERNFMLRERVIYFIYGLKSSVRICIWLAMVTISWFLLFDSKVEKSSKNRKILNYISRAFAALLAASFIWLLKTLLIKVMASNFHVKTFFDRIQESIFKQYVLRTLSGPPLMELQLTAMNEEAQNNKIGCLGRMGFSKKGETNDGSVNPFNLEQLQQLNTQNVSAWNMKKLIHVIKNTHLSTLSNDIQDQHNITGQMEAKYAAVQIFQNVARPGAKFIKREDLARFLEWNEVDEVLQQFEGSYETGKIKKSALKSWVVNTFEERRALAHALNDTKTAVKQLTQLVNVVVGIVIIIVVLSIVGLATSKLLVLVSSQLLLAAFIFGNTCKTIFEAIVFVFVMHPFDVGDRCVVDGVHMIVEEMNILTTTFLRYDNEKIFYPNSVLASKPISNFQRSPPMGDDIAFDVDFSTSMDKIGALKDKIAKYMESKPHHWNPKFTLAVKEIVDMNSMKMALYFSHTISYQSMGDKTNRKTDLILALKRILEQLEIKYHMLPQDLSVKLQGSSS